MYGKRFLNLKIKNTFVKHNKLLLGHSVEPVERPMVTVLFNFPPSRYNSVVGVALSVDIC